MPLKHRLTMPGSAGTWPGELPVQSLYTAGVAGDRFLKTLKTKGKLTGSACPTCKEVHVPPRLFCERCMAELTEWVDLPLTGTLISWTAVHEGLDGARLAKPQTIGLIRIDGATTTLIHRLDDLGKAGPAIGMRVRAVLKPAGKREGAITDILHFRPA
jgi:uncharacterized OB-fold protein